MIAKTLLKYKILDYCLDVLFRKLYTNFFVSDKLLPGNFFKRIEYSLEHHEVNILCTDCIIIRRYINENKEDYIDFSFKDMYVGEIILEIDMSPSEDGKKHRSKSQAPVNRLTFVE